MRIVHMFAFAFQADLYDEVDATLEEYGIVLRVRWGRNYFTWPYLENTGGVWAITG